MNNYKFYILLIYQLLFGYIYKELEIKIEANVLKVLQINLNS